jgi:hypothetical protein
MSRPVIPPLQLVRPGIVAVGDRAALRIVNAAAARLTGWQTCGGREEPEHEATARRQRELRQVWRALGWIPQQGG